MAKENPQTIILYWNSENEARPTQNGIVQTAEPIVPGYLIEIAADGDLQPHGTLGAAAALQHNKMFAVENPQIESGHTNDATIDHAYAAGEVCRYVFCQTGDVVYAKLATQETITIGEFLESANDGLLQTLSSTFPVGVALEAVTTAGSVARIKVRIV